MSPGQDPWLKLRFVTPPAAFRATLGGCTVKLVTFRCFGVKAGVTAVVKAVVTAEVTAGVTARVTAGARASWASTATNPSESPHPHLYHLISQGCLKCNIEALMGPEKKRFRIIILTGHSNIFKVILLKDQDLAKFRGGKLKETPYKNFQ